MRPHRVEPVRAAGWLVGIFWLGSMLTARSECHVFSEAAVIRSGIGTLHEGRVSFSISRQGSALQHANNNTWYLVTLLIDARKAAFLLICFMTKKGESVL